MLLVLVLANLLFFGWANWVDRPVVRVRAAAPVSTLQLAPASPGRAATATAMPLCRSLGPYADEAAAVTATAVLRQRGVAARARHVDTAVADGYWVYVVATEPARRQQVMQQLARAGVGDAAIVADESGGRVSAGIFTEQKGAEARAAAVRSAGLEPVLEARQKTTSVWWLDLSLTDATAAPRVDDAELRAGGAQLQLTDCP